MANKKRILIMGAAGRDFHNFNVYFRDNEEYEVVGFTATQIPNIEGRTYPAEIAGRLYPAGIPIFPESELSRLVREKQVDQVVFAYSDVPHEYVMHKASEVLAAGADYRLMGPNTTMMQAKVPVAAVCAVRTGSGKSQTTRKVAEVLTKAGKNVVVIRHPMPYGDLSLQKVQRFASYEDLDRHKCTIEEREEYEPHIDRGNTVYAGVDYGAILQEAEKEADVILWDGGNNDMPFYRPDVLFTVVDPHRPGHELTYHPGEANLRMADYVVVNKMATADPDNIKVVLENVRRVNPTAKVIEANSPITVEEPESLRGKSVLVVEDGPTLTHGEMKYGAGVIAAKKYGAKLIDPRPFAFGTIRETFRKYSHLEELLPAMGYGERQLRELEETINAMDVDAVVIGTPIDLRRVIEIRHRALRVRYELQERGEITVESALRSSGLV